LLSKIKFSLFISWRVPILFHALDIPVYPSLLLAACGVSGRKPRGTAALPMNDTAKPQINDLRIISGAVK
jgi:hypothetical protein